MNKMSKSTTYSWRLSSELKARLEAAARDERTDVGTILERVIGEWLARRPRQLSAEEQADEQRQRRERLMQAVGTVALDLPSATNAEVRKVMGEQLMKKYRESQRRAPKRAR
jgi:predicted transcriptional regulator